MIFRFFTVFASCDQQRGVSDDRGMPETLSQGCIDAIHTACQVHTDLKPENILLVSIEAAHPTGGGAGGAAATSSCNGGVNGERRSSAASSNSEGEAADAMSVCNL